MLLMFSSAVVSADACCLVQAQVWTKRHSEPTLVEWNLTKWSSWFQLSNHSDPILSTRLRTDAQSNNLIITILQDLSLEQLVSSAEISNGTRAIITRHSAKHRILRLIRIYTSRRDSGATTAASRRRQQCFALLTGEGVDAALSACCNSNSAANPVKSGALI
eukprot:GHVU01024301.1.p1 GENE.GHVU01024301.1~~GHVU01024301.1.p1  ORF type:complete len:162 (+),score=2.50 GHVU01024301.1:1796-2281(+)